MASGEDIDSGMSSQNSKAVTPEKMPAIEGPEEDEVRSPVAVSIWIIWVNSSHQ